MIASTLYLTQPDHQRVTSLIDRAVNSTDPRLRADLRRLCEGLQQACIVPAENIPADVVTINSRVMVEDLKTHERNVWLLTLPNESDIHDGRLSVFSPLGIALFGAYVGQVVHWQNSTARGSVRVVKILFQPESEGRFDL